MDKSDTLPTLESRAQMDIKQEHSDAESASATIHGDNTPQDTRYGDDFGQIGSNVGCLDQPVSAADYVYDNKSGTTDLTHRSEKVNIQGARKEVGLKEMQECDICLKLIKVFSTFVYQQHMAQHPSNKPYRCYICEECFDDARSLETHVTRHVGNNDGGKSEKTEMTTWLKDDPSKAETEGQIDIKKEVEDVEVGEESEEDSDESGESTEPYDGVDNVNLQDQPSLSQDTNPQVKDSKDCNTSNCRDTSSNNLSQHISNISTGSDPTLKLTRKRGGFVGTCEFCNKIFHNNWKLQRHRMVHTGERPYKCDKCDKSFHRNDALQIHQTDVHSELAKVPCEYCGQECKPVSMRKHVYEKHPEEHKTMMEAKVEDKKCYSLKCRICLAEFDTKSKLRYHTKILHGVANTNTLKQETNICLDTNPQIKDSEESKTMNSFESSSNTFSEGGTHGEQPQVKDSEDSNTCSSMETTSNTLCQDVILGDSNISSSSNPAAKLTRPRGGFVEACEFCNKVFYSDWKLQSHRKIHTGERPYKCDECEKCFYRIDALQIHKENVHTEVANVACEYCGKGYKPRNMRKHVSTMHPQEFQAMEQAKQEEKEKTNLKCRVCTEKFETRRRLAYHIKKVHGQKIHICLVCNKTFGMQYKLTEHLKIHTGELPYECQKCGTGHKTELELQKHTDNNCYKKKRIRSGTFPCNVCGKILSTPHTLRYHVLTHSVEQPHPCDICGKRFSSKSKLKVHLDTHNPEKNVICPLCSSAFRNNKHLRQHMKRIHKEGDEADKPFKCDYCDKRFHYETRLKGHVMIHTKEKPYICDVCGRGFRLKHTLFLHQQIHTGTKEHKCTYCGRDFRMKDTLVEHMRVHTGEQPFQCSTCGKRFRYIANWRQHQKKCAALASGLPDPTPKRKKRKADRGSDTGRGEYDRSMD